MSDVTVNILLIITYTLLGVGALGAIIFPIITMIGDMEKAKRALVGIGGVAVVFFFSYMLSGNEVLDSYVKYGVTETSSKMVGAVLIMMYTLGLGAIVMAIAGEIYKAFK
ncbi:MAG: hypothetical protein ACK417_10550 [Bacteroidia bacterium]|jgi:hypothetical protein